MAGRVNGRKRGAQRKNQRDREVKMRAQDMWQMMTKFKLCSREVALRWSKQVGADGQAER